MKQGSVQLIAECKNGANFHIEQVNPGRLVAHWKPYLLTAPEPQINLPGNLLSIIEREGKDGENSMHNKCYGLRRGESNRPNMRPRRLPTHNQTGFSWVPSVGQCWLHYYHLETHLDDEEIFTRTPIHQKVAQVVQYQHRGTTRQIIGPPAPSNRWNPRKSSLLPINSEQCLRHRRFPSFSECRPINLRRGKLQCCPFRR